MATTFSGRHYSRHLLSAFDKKITHIKKTESLGSLSYKNSLDSYFHNGYHHEAHLPVGLTVKAVIIYQ
ncbi:hypothetical protein [Buttiauxella sp.]|uniref:hypothetical protein n=1 Tax=Buttiauxella sp. TaxID=1972222 RepID=UPI003C742FF5